MGVQRGGEGGTPQGMGVVVDPLEVTQPIREYEHVPSVEVRVDVRTYKEGRENQDAVCVEPDLGLFAVCDGMGGYEGGREVALTATIFLTEQYKLALQEHSGNVEKAVAQTIKNLNEKLALWKEEQIRNKSIDNGIDVGERTATTIASVFLEDTPAGTQAHVLNVGDSRVYVYREQTNKLECASVDNSYVIDFLSCNLPRIIFESKYLMGVYIHQDLFNDRKKLVAAIDTVLQRIYSKDGGDTLEKRMTALRAYFSNLKELPTLVFFKNLPADTTEEQLAEWALQYFWNDQRNTITEWLPNKNVVMSPSKVHLHTLSVAPGDILLLVTDGITDSITDAELKQIIVDNDIETIQARIHERIIENGNRFPSQPDFETTFKEDDANSIVIAIPERK